MTAHSAIHPTLAIPEAHIDAAIRALIALRAQPQMDGYRYLAVLRTIDAIEGRDALAEAISTVESDLGLDDEPEHRFVRSSGEYFDGDLVEVRSAYGMGGR